MRVLMESSGQVLAYRVYFSLNSPIWTALTSQGIHSVIEKIKVGEGVLLGRRKRASVLFVKHPVDALYLGKDGAVLHVLAPLRPWRIGPRIQGAQSILIIPAGEAQAIRLGDRLRFAE